MLNDTKNPKEIVEGNTIDDLLITLIKSLYSLGEKYKCVCRTEQSLDVEMKTYTLEIWSTQCDSFIHAVLIWDIRNWNCESQNLRAWWGITRVTYGSIEDEDYNLKDGLNIIRKFIFENGILPIQTSH
ncbi:hypothetical protein [Paenibacillus pseudetheri]|uniref:Uncharacterized protein n=1 Tax=Paenibacillus pseudetheri TaxID=2897682 RepID=A0ABN8FI56_9BACL|nr:hypothetical protein [Paenibacillus pseudetheri]CAH1056822.1 hypothetical protein PAECIP111894_02977 [Paenibacillus pseudetheri]